MRFLICGAGQVGATIADQLAKEGNQVSLIDQDPELVAKINDTIDATAFVGHASHPATLQKAGADARSLIGFLVSLVQNHPLAKAAKMNSIPLLS